MRGSNQLTKNILMPRLKEKYYREVIPALKKKFGYQNVMAVPRLVKVVINMGRGEATQDIKVLDRAVSELSIITGQKPIITRAKRSISNFKLRKGVPIGCKVTLRGARMYEFLDRFINVALPRIRDFRGVTAQSFDGRGNYNLGIREQIIFPEIDYDKIDKVRGMDVAVITTARNDEESRELLRLLGMPFRD